MNGANCDRKATYKAEHNAKTKLRKLRKNVIDPFGLQVYWCDRHNGWHIGTKRSPEMRRMIRGYSRWDSR